MPDGTGPRAAVIRRAGSAEAQPLAIEGLLPISVRRFADARGAFVETDSWRDFAAIGIPDEFVQDNQSLPVQFGTVRGLDCSLIGRVLGTSPADWRQPLSQCLDKLLGRRLAGSAQAGSAKENRV